MGEIRRAGVRVSYDPVCSDPLSVLRSCFSAPFFASSLDVVLDCSYGFIPVARVVLRLGL